MSAFSVFNEIMRKKVVLVREFFSAYEHCFLSLKPKCAVCLCP